MKRVIAWIGIIILGSLYLLTLVSALLEPAIGASLFWASLYCTIIVPIIMFILMRLHDYATKGKKEFIEQMSDEETAKETETKEVETVAETEEAVENTEE
ncbi:MAG: hypothetical protein E7266_10395 [Lachnospiraceae bacterium]|nr:hypothetical protein [Lachnospiraceae bacterium]